MPIVQQEALKTLGSDLLVTAGVPPEDADIWRQVGGRRHRDHGAGH